MNVNKLNNVILCLEALILSLPICYLMIMIGIPIGFMQLVQHFGVGNVIIAMVLLLSTYAIISLWCLIVFHIRQRTILASNYLGYWLGIIFGTLIALIAALVYYAHTQQGVIPKRWFVEEFSMFMLGLPLIVPSVHLYLSARIRASRSNI